LIDGLEVIELGRKRRMRGPPKHSWQSSRYETYYAPTITKKFRGKTYRVTGSVMHTSEVDPSTGDNFWFIDCELRRGDDLIYEDETYPRTMDRKGEAKRELRDRMRYLAENIEDFV